MTEKFKLTNYEPGDPVQLEVMYGTWTDPAWKDYKPPPVSWLRRRRLALRDFNCRVRDAWLVLTGKAEIDRYND